jgi:hypothetical protein
MEFDVDHASPIDRIPAGIPRWDESNFQSGLDGLLIQAIS